MGVKVFTTQRIGTRVSASELSAIAKLFSQYKESGIAPGEFGRDTDFKDPHSAIVAKLMHIHVDDGTFKMKAVQFGRTSDTFLIYCQGQVSKDNYLLIDFIANAHVRTRKITYMADLAEIAEKFRVKR